MLQYDNLMHTGHDHVQIFGTRVITILTASWEFVTDTEVTSVAQATYASVNTIEDCKLKAAARIDFRVE